jgi:hypothetical protein
MRKVTRKGRMKALSNKRCIFFIKNDPFAYEPAGAGKYHHRFFIDDITLMPVL